MIQDTISVKRKLMDFTDPNNLQKGNLLLKNMKIMKQYLREMYENKLVIQFDEIRWSSDDEDATFFPQDKEVQD